MENILHRWANNGNNEDIDEDLIPYYKCEGCGMNVCKDEFNRDRKLCLNCIDRDEAKEEITELVADIWVKR